MIYPQLPEYVFHYPMYIYDPMFVTSAYTNTLDFIFYIIFHIFSLNNPCRSKGKMNDALSPKP